MMPSVYPKNFQGSARSPVASVTKYLSAGDFRSAAPLAYRVANENAGRIARALGVSSAMARALAGIGSKALPVLGAALTAYDLWRLGKSVYDWYFDPYSPNVPPNYVRPVSVQEPVFYKTLLPDYSAWGWTGGWMNVDWPEAEYVAMNWQPVDTPNTTPFESRTGVSYPPAVSYAFYGPPLWVPTYIPYYQTWYLDYLKIDPLNWSGDPETSQFFRRGELQKFDPTGLDAPSIPDGDGRPIRPIFPDFLHSFLPSLDPSLTPIGDFQNVPKPIPYRILPYVRQNPFRAPEYQRQHGYDLATLPKLAPNMLPYAASPYAILASRAAARRAPRLALGHELRPPKAGDKEKKYRVPYSSFLLPVVNSITEARDTLVAVYEALPSRVRPRSRQTPQQMLKILYDNFELLDGKQAIYNIVKESLTDLLYGFPARGVAEQSKRLRPHSELSIGFQAGPAL